MTITAGGIIVLMVFGWMLFTLLYTIAVWIFTKLFAPMHEVEITYYSTISRVKKIRKVYVKTWTALTAFEKAIHKYSYECSLNAVTNLKLKKVVNC